MNEREKFNNNLGHYVRHAQITAHFAERATGITISNDTVEKWGVLYACISAADDEIDGLQSPQERSRLGDNLIRYFSGEEIIFPDPHLALTMEKLKDLQDDLPSDQKNLFQRSLKGVLRVTERMRTASTVDEFSFLRRLEGQFIMRSVSAIVPEKTDESHVMFNLVLTRFGRVANMVDSFFDLPLDYMRGETLLKPTIQNRLLLVKNSIKDGVFLLKTLKPSLSLARELSWGTQNLAKNHNGKKHLLSS